MYFDSFFVLCFLQIKRSEEEAESRRQQAKRSRIDPRAGEMGDDDEEDGEETPGGRRYPMRNRRHTDVYQGESSSLYFC